MNGKRLRLLVILAGAFLIDSWMPLGVRLDHGVYPYDRGWSSRRAFWASASIDR